MAGRKPCAICRSDSWNAWPEGAGTTYRIRIDCSVCGKCIFTPKALEEIDREVNRTLMPYLSAHIRQHTDSAPGEDLFITHDNWREAAASHASTPVSVKVRKLLEHLSRRTSIGQWLYPHDADGYRRIAAAADLRDQEELAFVLAHLGHQDLVEKESLPPPPERRNPDGGYDAVEDGIRLTVGGWDAVAPASGGGVVGTCFIAMCFAPQLNEAYREGLFKGMTDAGFRGGRVDSIPHNAEITDRIRAGIRSAQIVVADFTLQRAGVYYEVGLAEGLGRPVIRTCREDDFEGLHFDTRQFNHLKWRTPADLRTTLAEHIKATIGLGPFGAKQS